jgi:hypothetical protein
MRSFGLKPEQMKPILEGMQKLIKDLNAAKQQHTAASTEWEAKNNFAAHVTGIAGVAGANPVHLQTGSKPRDLSGNSTQIDPKEAKFSDPNYFSQPSRSAAPRLRDNTPDK